MNLLIVDDDPTSLKLLRAQLEYEGNAVFEAHDGVDAIAVLERQRVDAVISDVLMPRMDGYRLCYEIRKHSHDLPIIIYSSTYTSPGDEKLALDVGADKYLKKPASVETLVAALHEVIAQPHAAPRPNALVEVEVLKQYSGQLVSKLKEKNTELMAAEVKFRALVEQSIAGIYIIQDDQFVYVNPRMAGIFGRSEEEMTSGTLYDFLVPEDHALARENIRKRISGGVSSIHYDLRVLHQSGAVLQVEVHGSRTDYNGRPAVMGMLADITARKEAETKLRESEARLRQLSSAIEQTADTVIITDREGTIQYVNAAFEGMTGYSAAEAVGRKPSLLKSGQHTPEFYEQLWRTIITGAPFRAVFVNRRKNGALIHEEETITPIKDERGNITHFVSTAKDITERRQAEAALQQSEARLQQAQRINSLGRVAATIAHEFNNVLMGIQPFAEMIHRRVGPDQDLGKAAESIINSIKRGKGVTAEILRFTNPSPPKLQVIQARPWLITLEPELRQLAGNTCPLEVELPDDSLSFAADQQQLEQVLSNLVVNARQAMSSGGAIRLRCSTAGPNTEFSFGKLDRQETFVQLSVTDEGSGIPDDIIGNVFDPLFTTKRTGTGLGLSVATQVIESHGGKIGVETVVGQGTTFHVLLPGIADPNLTGGDRVPGSAGRRLPKRLLLVEDEPEIAEGLAVLLDLDGIEVTIAGTGGEVAAAVERCNPDLVILDFGLPDMDGAIVYAMLQERWPQLPVIVSSGHAPAPRQEREAVFHLQKPYAYEALVQMISIALESVQDA